MAVYYIEFYFLRRREEEGGKRREEGGERTPSRICYRVSGLFSLLLPLSSLKRFSELARLLWVVPT